MRTRLVFVSASLATLATVGVSACGVSSHHHVAQAVSHHVIYGTEDKTYADLGAVRQDSTTVVLATVTGQRVIPNADEQGTSGIPATISTLSVQKVVAGAEPGASIQLRQLGSPGDVTDDGVPVLSTGTQYLVFLRPFEFHAGQLTGEYSPTTDAAIYAAAHNGELTRLAHESGLPARASVATMAATLR